MMSERTLAGGAGLWALVGYLLAARWTIPASPGWALVLASLLLPACSVLAAAALVRHRIGSAGVLLLLSSATPTYFAWPLNLVALAAGAYLVFISGWRRASE